MATCMVTMSGVHFLLVLDENCSHPIYIKFLIQDSVRHRARDNHVISHVLNKLK